MSPGILLAIIAGATLVVAAMILAAVVRHAPRPRSADALARADFAAAVGAAGPAAAVEELVPAAIAARHLGDLETAERLSRRAVEAEPTDGEAWLEHGLVAAYSGRLETAMTALDRAATLRSDLLEGVTLHRAWIALKAGDHASARRWFDEVEAPLETKLRTDLGGGDPVFADWFFQAAELWQAFGETERAAWARSEAQGSAPGSSLFDKASGNP